MQTIFTSGSSLAKESFSQWHSFCDERIVPMKHTQLSEDVFFASAAGTSIGSLVITEMSLGNLRLETTNQTIRNQRNRSDNIFMSLILEGAVKVDQSGYSTIDRSGDFGVRDQNSPWRIQYDEQTRLVAIELPRQKLEGMLGPARNFAGLTINADLPSVTLARSFLLNLMRVGSRLTPDAAERMASVGTDLIVSSLAERMALATPKPLRNTVALQQAKAFIEANISSPSLDPSQVAAAVRVSLRQLHSLFADHECNVADWIWHRRLKLAAQRLTNPTYLSVQIGTLAYNCGFTSQAHFSRRFRDRYGMGPREFRHMANLKNTLKAVA